MSTPSKTEVEQLGCFRCGETFYSATPRAICPICVAMESTLDLMEQRAESDANNAAKIKGQAMTPSKAEVERTIRLLELPWWEAARMRWFYRWARLHGEWWWKPSVYCLTVILWSLVVAVAVILALAA